MVFGKVLSSFSIVIVIFMVVFTLFVHSSRTRLQGGAVQDTAIATQNVERHMVESFEKSVTVIVAEEEAREVPTGPDPLHHNNNPTTRP